MKRAILLLSLITLTQNQILPHGGHGGGHGHSGHGHGHGRGFGHRGFGHRGWGGWRGFGSGWWGNYWWLAPTVFTTTYVDSLRYNELRDRIADLQNALDRVNDQDRYRYQEALEKLQRRLHILEAQQKPSNSMNTIERDIQGVEQDIEEYV